MTYWRTLLVRALTGAGERLVGAEYRSDGEPIVGALAAEEWTIEEVRVLGLIPRRDPG